ncbi:MAG: hypothetical protein AAF561_01590 [Planctomycetota bacterium]
MTLPTATSLVNMQPDGGYWKLQALFLGTLTLLPLVLVCTIRFAGRLYFAIKYKLDNGSKLPELRRLLVALLVGTLVTVAGHWGVTWRTAFLFSRSEMETLAAEVRKLPEHTMLQRRVGIWGDVTVIHDDAGIVVIDLLQTKQGPGFVGWRGGGIGFIHLPDGVSMPGYNEAWAIGQGDGPLGNGWRHFATD